MFVEAISPVYFAACNDNINGFDSGIDDLISNLMLYLHAPLLTDVFL